MNDVQQIKHYLGAGTGITEDGRLVTGVAPGQSLGLVQHGRFLAPMPQKTWQPVFRQRKKAQVYGVKRARIVFIKVIILVDDIGFGWLHIPVPRGTQEQWTFMMKGPIASSPTLQVCKGIQSTLYFVCRSNKLVYQRFAAKIWETDENGTILKLLLETGKASTNKWWNVWQSSCRDDLVAKEEVLERLKGWMPVEGELPTILYDIGEIDSDGFLWWSIWGPEGSLPAQEEGLWNVFQVSVDDLFRLRTF